MNILQRSYYQEMLHKGRLFPFIRGERLVCFLTYYITNNEKLYIDDPWQISEDNEHGKLCYIMQLITDKHSENPKLSYEIWHNFKGHIKNKYSNVEKIIWRRWNWKKGKISIYSKEIK
jgi:hypothetical protein